jgi:hypothetical protein
MTGEGEVKKFLLAGFAFAALSLPAAAADMPVKAPAPVAVDIWTGGYVGANVNFGGVTTTTQLIQPNFALGGVQGTATATTSTHLHDNIARVGINWKPW